MNKYADYVNDFYEKAAAEAALLRNNELPACEDAEHVFSAEHNKKMKKMFAEAKRKARRGSLPRTLAKAACIFIAVVAAGGTAVMSVDAWKAKILDYIANPKKDLSIADKYGNRLKDGGIILNYVPEGFELIESTDLDDYSDVIYDNADKSQRLIVEVKAQTFMQEFDTANGVIIPENFNGHDAVYAENSRNRVLVWEYGDFFVCVCGNISKEDIYAVAEGLEINK